MGRNVGPLRRLKGTTTIAAALVIVAAIFFALGRISHLLGGFRCVFRDVYGEGDPACRAALQGRGDPWAAYVVGAFLLYALGGLGFLWYSTAKDRDWKGIGVFLLIGLGWFIIVLLKR